MIYEMLSGINPFKLRNKNKMEKLQMITDKDIPMRPEFSDVASSLLMGLLKRNVSIYLFVVNMSIIEYSRRKDLVQKASMTSSATSSLMVSTGKLCRQSQLLYLSFLKSVMI